MKVVQRAGNPDVAMVYIAQMDSGHKIEFVESVEPPIPRDTKWVNILSTLHGCPVRCAFCDAGLRYKGKLSAQEMLDQIDYMVGRRYPSKSIPCEKWKIQFARMGDPAFNRAVMDVLRDLPQRYDAPGLFPSISTIAPCGCDRFFEELINVKHELYPERFQFQFSLHSSKEATRKRLIPVDTWSFVEMAEYAERLYSGVGRKPSLNFALMQGVEVDPVVLRNSFSPDLFVIKLTPLNPTCQSEDNRLNSLYKQEDEWNRTVERLRSVGYTVIVSVGELEENAIGSNCGQYIQALEGNGEKPEGSYCYAIETEPV
ncbi:radical SAM protein [bacterium]|nr:radical SAM protein [bacterium]